MTTNRLLNIGKLTALLSFLSGTVIFILYYLTDAFRLLALGYGFIVVAGLLNLIVLIMLLIQLRKQKDLVRKIIATCLLIVLNLPIIWTYFWITTILLNTMRITFVNETSAKLTDIRIFGCENCFIDKLDPGESEKVWVAIKGDCSINIEFLSDGKKQSENVSGYVTNNTGQRMTHKIGWENGPAKY